MQIEVWSDFNCPWCWLGKRHLELALENRGLAGDAEVRLRSFELSPGFGASRPAATYLAERYGDPGPVRAAQARLTEMGARVGLPYDFGRAMMADSFDAHRVHLFAAQRGRGAAVAALLFRAVHAEGRDIGDAATLVALAVDAGLDAGEAEAVVEGEAFAEAVGADEAEARALGVRGVPFFVVDRRFALSGAQPVAAFEAALQQAATHPERAK